MESDRQKKSALSITWPTETRLVGMPRPKESKALSNDLTNLLCNALRKAIQPSSRPPP